MRYDTRLVRIYGDNIPSLIITDVYYDDKGAPLTYSTIPVQMVGLDVKATSTADYNESAALMDMHDVVSKAINDAMTQPILDSVSDFPMLDDSVFGISLDEMNAGV